MKTPPLPHESKDLISHPSTDPITDIVIQLESSHPLTQMRVKPEQLWIRGKESAFQLLAKLPTHGLTIVGSRFPKSESRILVRDTLRSMRGSPLIILSGIARGIDAEAHLGALNAGLPTIAVLGGGFDRFYPESNLELGHKILESGGLWISEFPPETEPKPYFFLQRNRLLASFSSGTWIVEAGGKSGTLSTADFAFESSKHVWVTPSFPNDSAFEGNLKLLRRHPECELFFDASSFASVWVSEFSNWAKKPKADNRRAFHRLS